MNGTHAFDQEHCLLCGINAHDPGDLFLIEWQSRASQDPSVFPISEDDVAWLGRTRIIGGPQRQRHSSDPERPKDNSIVLLTGILRYRDRHYDFTRGNANNSDFAGLTTKIRGKGSREVLRIEMTDLWDLHRENPTVYLLIHDRCLAMLKCVERLSQGLGYADTTGGQEELTLDMFDRLRQRWQFLPIHDQDDEDSEPSEDITSRTIEKDVFPVSNNSSYDPCSDGYIKSLIPLPNFSTGQRHTGPGQTHSSLAVHTSVSDRSAESFLARLPREILLNIAEFMTAHEVRAVCYASKEAAWTLNQPAFWFARIKADMPWLWDFNRERILTEQAEIESLGPEYYDWQEIYFLLREMAAGSSPKRYPSLVNRRRIWRLCETLVES